MICKIYNDGSHFVAQAILKKQEKQKKPVYKVALATEIDKAFDIAFANAQHLNKLSEQKSFIREALLDSNEDDELLTDYIERRFKSKKHALNSRRKRFLRKANLNKWNYFITFTYDDKKCTVETFEKSLKKCLSNLATRRGWVFAMNSEYGAKTGRKHFHALAYIPEGQMVGKITKKRDYSKRLFKSRYRYENDFFTKFGRNDFQPITSKNKRELKKAIDYIAKYMNKSTEKTMYSRGIPSEIYKDVPNDEIACEMVDFVLKYVLYDDIFETDNIYVKKSVTDNNYYDLSEFEE